MYPSISVTRTQKPAAKHASDASLGFGQLFTDHMIVMEYVDGQGWIDARIVPYAPLSLAPSASVFITDRLFSRA